MTDKERMAVLKLAGFKIRRRKHWTGNGYLWDWATDETTSAGYCNTQGRAIKAAFSYLTETHQNNL